MLPGSDICICSRTKNSHKKYFICVTLWLLNYKLAQMLSYLVAIPFDTDIVNFIFEIHTQYLIMKKVVRRETEFSR